MKRRTKYSHNGCQKCKSSSVKCDETRPSCLNCSRRGFQCEYKSNVFVYQPQETVRKKKRDAKGVTYKDKVRNTHTENTVQLLGTPRTVSFKIIDEVIDLMRVDFNSRTSKPLSGATNKNLGCEAMNGLCSKNCTEIPGYVEFWKPFDEERYLYLDHKLDSKGENTTGIHFHEDDPEAQEFLFYSMVRTNYVHNFVLVTDEYQKCLTHWFLYFSKKYSIIGHTINSITSNLLDIVCRDDRWSCILQRTMSITLMNISQRVGSCNSFPEMVCYLICIMFLFSERSASRLDAWRLHLKGAFAIVEKCNSLYAEISNSIDEIDYEMKLAARMYAWTKNWFVASETIACLSAPKGGAIENIELSRHYLSYNSHKSIEEDKQNAFLVDSFNLMKGYSQNLTPVFTGIIEYIMSYKAIEGVSLSGSEGILQSVTVNEPQIKLGNRLLNKVKEVEGEQFDFSLIYDYRKRAIMKACNTCYCCAIRIFTFSVILGKSIYGKEVQYWVQCIEEQLATIHDIASLGLCIHWPLFVAALCAPNKDQRKTFITAIENIANNGTYVARNTVERLHNCWKIIDCGGVVNEEDYDCTTM